MCTERADIGLGAATAKTAIKDAKTANTFFRLSIVAPLTGFEF
jgi:hypothetical protein